MTLSAKYLFEQPREPFTTKFETMQGFFRFLANLTFEAEKRMKASATVARKEARRTSSQKESENLKETIKDSRRGEKGIISRLSKKTKTGRLLGGLLS